MSGRAATLQSLETLDPLAIVGRSLGEKWSPESDGDAHNARLCSVIGS
jgi:hypothetical protein